MEMNKDNFLLADYISDDDDDDKSCYNIESIYKNDFNEKKILNNDSLSIMYNYKDRNDNSSKLINININKSCINELNAYFKLNNLFTCIKNDENKKSNKILKQDMSISKIIMNTIIDKKLGSITYHYGNNKSAKAYYTYDYPEIYYNKKLFNNISEWLKKEFFKKI